MHCVYIPKSQIFQDTIHINDPERHHLLNVLRLKRGDEVQIFDGEGNRYIAALRDIRSDTVIASIQHHRFHPPTLPRITLFQGMPKFDKFDLIVQKTTEIGVDTIVPMTCQRSIPKRTAMKQKKRVQRWQRIAIEASKQCKRPRFPKVEDGREMAACLEQSSQFDVSILFWEKATQHHIKSLLRNHPPIQSIGLFIGPEGGFSDDEVHAAIQHGCIPASLGDNILRTETAAIVSVALVSYELREK